MPKNVEKMEKDTLQLIIPSKLKKGFKKYEEFRIRF